MRILFYLVFFTVGLTSQEIVDETIQTQVDASNVSIELQKRIDSLDIESVSYTHLTLPTKRIV